MTAVSSLTPLDLHGSRDLVSMQDEWSALCDRAPASIFQRPEWLLPYAASFPGECSGVAFLSGTKPVALLLLIEQEEARHTTASLLGTGLSDHLDAIVERAAAASVCRPIHEWLVRTSERWDRIDFQQLPADSVLLRVPEPEGFASRCEPHEPSPVVALDTACAGVPAHMTRKLQYYSRRARARGEVSFEAATPATCEALFDELVRLHRCRWTDGGVFDDPRVVCFHRAVVRPMAERNRLALHLMCVDGQPVAASYGFVDGRRATYYIGGFDPAFADISPGTLTLAHAIEDARRRGAREFDLLRGRERYKYSWGAADEPAFRRVLERRF